jgi:hypothetical protein
MAESVELPAQAVQVEMVVPEQMVTGVEMQVPVVKAVLAERFLLAGLLAKVMAIFQLHIQEKALLQLLEPAAKPAVSVVLAVQLELGAEMVLAVMADRAGQLEL